MSGWAQAWSWFGAIAIGLLALALAAKVLWNFGTAYVLMARAAKAPPGESVGISMSPFVEFALWLLCLILAWATFQAGMLRPGNVALYGLLAIVASYLHLFAVGMISGWLRRKRSP